ncbi:PEGA domain-containing protein [Candidatus Margulisiibacteriota bacterium]
MEVIVETSEPESGFIESQSKAPVRKTRQTKARTTKKKSTKKVYKEAVVKYGQIVVSSKPSAAKVYFNNVYKGNTPMFKKIKAGKYAVKIIKEGYSSYRTLLTVPTDGRKTLSVKLLLK